MIQFIAVPRQKPVACNLVYRADEYSFDTELCSEETRKYCVTINEVQIELDHERRATAVSGYCPLTSFTEIGDMPPRAGAANLMVVSPECLIERIAIGITDLHTRWPGYYNDNGWVCLGDPIHQGDCAVEFLPRCIAVLHDKAIKAVWLKPRIINVSRTQ